MKWLVGAAVAVLLAPVAPAHAIDISFPSLACLVFCDQKPAAKDAKPVAAPRDLHPPHKVSSAAPVVEPRRLWRPVHAKPRYFAYRPHPVVATAPHPVPTPPEPSRVAVAAPAPTPTAAPAPSPAGTSEPSPAAIASVAQAAAAPEPRPIAREPDPAIQLLAQAFSESPQPTPVASSPPPTAEAVVAPPPSHPAEVAAPPPPSAVAMVDPAEPSAIVQVTANGLVFPWWPTHFPGRAAVWIVVALTLIAGGVFGLARASGRRIAA